MSTLRKIADDVRCEAAHLSTRVRLTVREGLIR